MCVREMFRKNRVCVMLGGKRCMCLCLMFRRKRVYMCEKEMFRRKQVCVRDV